MNELYQVISAALNVTNLRIVIILDSFVEDTVEVCSEYGQLMKRVCSYEEFKKFMDDLISGKYEGFSE